MMAKYRKKPVIIDAEIYTDLVSVSRIIDMNGSAIGINNSPEGLYIHTLEGTMLASKGDYIIKGIKGEIYPCKPDIFEATYESIILTEE